MSDLFDLPFEDDDAPIVDDRPDRPDRPLGTVGTPSQTPVTARRVLTVTELTVQLRDVLEAQFYEVWVEGELSYCRVWNTGHLYCTLKDKSSQLHLVIGHADRLAY